MSSIANNGLSVYSRLRLHLLPHSTIGVVYRKSYRVIVRLRDPGKGKGVSRGNVHALEPMRSNRNRPKVSERAKGPWPEMQR